MSHVSLWRRVSQEGGTACAKCSQALSVPGMSEDPSRAQFGRDRVRERELEEVRAAGAGAGSWGSWRP